jgi:hypothetical protein
VIFALMPPSGNWEFGANEGPTKWPPVKADVSITSAKTGSDATMLTWFINGLHALQVSVSPGIQRIRG